MKMIRTGMWLILGAVAVLGLSVATSHAAVWGGHEYEIILSEGISRTAAVSAAGGAGWYLATIQNAGEEAFIETLLGIASARNEYWLGGVLNTSTNTWGWYNGDPWTYQQWGEGQPDNWITDQPQLYLAIDSDQNSWDWDDNSGTTSVIRGYIRERVASVPEPSTLLLLGSGLLGLVGYGKRRMKK